MALQVCELFSLNVLFAKLNCTSQDCQCADNGVLVVEVVVQKQIR